MGELGAGGLVDLHRVGRAGFVVVGVPVRVADLVPEPVVEVREARAVAVLVARHVDLAGGIGEEGRVIGRLARGVVGVLVGPEVHPEHDPGLRIVAVGPAVLGVHDGLGRGEGAVGLIQRRRPAVQVVGGDPDAAELDGPHLSEGQLVALLRLPHLLELLARVAALLAGVLAVRRHRGVGRQGLVERCAEPRDARPARGTDERGGRAVAGHPLERGDVGRRQPDGVAQGDAAHRGGRVRGLGGLVIEAFAFAQMQRERTSCAPAPGRFVSVGAWRKHPSIPASTSASR